MHQVCSQLTHLDGSGVPTGLLDLVFSNVPELFDPYASVMPPISSYYHLPVAISSTSPTQTNSSSFWTRQVVYFPGNILTKWPIPDFTSMTENMFFEQENDINKI